MKLLTILFALAAVQLVAGQQYAYLLYFSNNVCADESFQASRGYFNEFATITGATASSCAEQMVCLVNPGSNACQAIANGQNEQVSMEVQDVNHVVLTTSSGAPTTVSVVDCTASDLYPGCYYQIFSAEHYQFYFSDDCDSTADDEDRASEDDDDNTSYLNYFSSNNCGEDSWEGAIPLNDDSVRIQGAGGDTCAIEMACLLNEDSDACAALGKRKIVEISVDVDNADGETVEIENGVETTFDSKDCTKSGLYDHCWFRYYTELEMKEFVKECDIDGSADSIYSSSSASLNSVSFVVVALAICAAFL